MSLRRWIADNFNILRHALSHFVIHCKNSVGIVAGGLAIAVSAYWCVGTITSKDNEDDDSKE